MKIDTFGSLCSGIEVASLVLKPLGVNPLWYSEIADFPSRFLRFKYPETVNLGDMNRLPQLIKQREIDVPDLLCGGTPCQAFSLTGKRDGLNDERGLLTLKYIEIADAIDDIRRQQGKDNTILFWENVEGVLSDKTNAFGCFLAGLSGLNEPLVVKKWSNAGVLYGQKRNIAWRVLDGKYFGLPQQRKRLYLLAGGKDFHPENILLEYGNKIADPFKLNDSSFPSLCLFEKSGNNNIDKTLIKNINNVNVEIFRTYTDCLYAAYGTKWNGNSASFNGSLFVSQNDKLRRITPLECERLMGMPDNYTLIEGCSHTNRYQAIGNSWAVPVVRWIMQRLLKNGSEISLSHFSISQSNYSLLLVDDFLKDGSKFINGSSIPYDYKVDNLINYVDTDASENFYISPKGCAGILRRKEERRVKINSRLERVLKLVAG